MGGKPKRAHADPGLSGGSDAFFSFRPQGGVTVKIRAEIAGEDSRGSLIKVRFLVEFALSLARSVGGRRKDLLGGVLDIPMASEMDIESPCTEVYSRRHFSTGSLRDDKFVTIIVNVPGKGEVGLEA